ncbi:unnamed protein product [Amoebophrya sp. A25]|nr:unnamed protein product [Amoebophrya sp. A25]|eukprot:GSA25T00014339001.1
MRHELKTSGELLEQLCALPKGDVAHGRSATIASRVGMPEGFRVRNPSWNPTRWNSEIVREHFHLRYREFESQEGKTKVALQDPVGLLRKTENGMRLFCLRWLNPGDRDEDRSKRTLSPLLFFPSLCASDSFSSALFDLLEEVLSLGLTRLEKDPRGLSAVILTAVTIAAALDYVAGAGAHHPLLNEHKLAPRLEYMLQSLLLTTKVQLEHLYALETYISRRNQAATPPTLQGGEVDRSSCSVRFAEQSF